MARYLWSIGQLINDPSPQLIDVFKRHVLDQEASPVVNTGTDAEANQNSCSRTIPSEVAPISDNPLALSEINANETAFQSKYVQAGNGTITGRQVSIQCPSSFYKKISRPTSVHQLKLVDRHTEAIPVAAKKDAVTNPGVKKVCTKHRQVYATLKQWPAIKVTIIESNIKSKIKALKNKLVYALDYFVLTKISSLPNEYSNNNNQIVRLYRSASIEEMNFEEVLTSKHKRNYRNKATTIE